MNPEQVTTIKANLYDRIMAGKTAEEIANKAVICRYVDATNDGELDLFDLFVDENYVENEPIPGQGPGREELKKAYVVFNGPFPDLEYVFEDLIAEGDLVFGRGVITGTHKGDFMGVPATGKQIRWTGTRLFRLKDLQVMEGWINVDMMGMMQQMGVIPAPPAPDPSTFPPAKHVTGAPSTREANKALMRRFIEEGCRFSPTCCHRRKYCGSGRPVVSLTGRRGILTMPLSMASTRPKSLTNQRKGLPSTSPLPWM